MIEIKENKKGTGVKKDCFAYKTTYKGEKCIALTELFCKEENCKFYQPKPKK